MRKLPLSLLIFIFPILVNAQKDLPRQKLAISLTLAVIPMTDNWQLGIQPGVSYQLNSHFMILTEVTFQTGKNDNSDPSWMDKEYLRIKPEVKYFFSSKAQEFRDYIGLQVSYTMRSFTSRDSYYYD